MRLLWLADVLRAEGLTVFEASGWKTRGVEFGRSIDGVIGHHTASNRRSGNFPSFSIVITGRPDLKGPLCQLLLGRDGSYFVIASGVANHAGSGAWPGISAGNHSTIGIEAENDGIGEPWNQKMLDAYVRGVAALLRHLNLGVERFASHYEWALPPGRKIDPAGPWIGGGDWYSGGRPRLSWSARDFRARVSDAMGEEMFSDEDRALLQRVEKKLDDYFGINADGTAKDIRAKIDAVWIDTHGADHRDLLAGRVKAIDRKLNEDAPI